MQENHSEKRLPDFLEHKCKFNKIQSVSYSRLFFSGHSNPSNQNLGKKNKRKFAEMIKSDNPIEKNPVNSASSFIFKIPEKPVKKHKPLPLQLEKPSLQRTESCYKLFFPTQRPPLQRTQSCYKLSFSRDS